MKTLRGARTLACRVHNLVNAMKIILLPIVFRRVRTRHAKVRAHEGLQQGDTRSAAGSRVRIALPSGRAKTTSLTA